METVGGHVQENVARIRQESGSSQADLAGRLSDLGWPVNKSTVAKIELGTRRVEVSECVTLARALRVPLSWLLRPWNGVEHPIERFTLGGVILRTSPLAFGRERRRLYAAAPDWVLAVDEEATVGELAERVMKAQDRANDARGELMDAVDDLFTAPDDEELLARAEAAFTRLRKAVAALGREQLGESKAIDAVTDGGS